MQLGFIGLGKMGCEMASHLVHGGFAVHDTRAGEHFRGPRLDIRAGKVANRIHGYFVSGMALSANAAR